MTTETETITNVPVTEALKAVIRAHYNACMNIAECTHEANQKDKNLAVFKECTKLAMTVGGYIIHETARSLEIDDETVDAIVAELKAEETIDNREEGNQR